MSKVIISTMAVYTASLPPKLIPIGPAEIVWNQTSDRCPGLNLFGHVGEQPDSMPEAWHNPLTNQTSFISATDWGTFATIGPSLNELTKHDCTHRVYTAINSSVPSDLASHQWLQSSVVFPNGSGAALIHSEFHGGMTGNYSLCSVQHNQANCQYWSAGLGVTHDGGNHWTLIDEPPKHLTFAIPRKYEKDSETTGFGAIGGLVFDDASGHFYGHVKQILAGIDPADTSATGVCAFRTPNIFDPRAFRGWNGSAWAVTWVDPYTASPQELTTGDHTCAVIGAGTSHPNMRRFAGDWRPTDWPSHILLGWPEGAKNKLSYSFPAWGSKSDAAFTQWSTAQIVDVGGWLNPEIFGPAHLMYPALFDADSPFKLGKGSAQGLSYSLLGNESVFVYFVIGRKYIARLPMAFVPGDAPDPIPPFGPSPPPPMDSKICPQFTVTGAGQADVNGIYVKTTQAVPSSDLPLFRKDSSHQLYSIQGMWRLAHYGVGPVYYSTSVSDDPRVPSATWTGTSPTALVTCSNPVGCQTFRVSGAGQADVNGDYIRMDRLSSGLPVFQKDGTHHIYSFQGSWKLGHQGETVYYYTEAFKARAVPVTGWGAGVAPQPLVTCADTPDILAMLV